MTQAKTPWFVRPGVVLPLVTLIVLITILFSPSPGDGRDSRLTSYSADPGGASQRSAALGRFVGKRWWWSWGESQQFAKWLVAVHEVPAEVATEAATRFRPDPDVDDAGRGPGRAAAAVQESGIL